MIVTPDVILAQGIEKVQLKRILQTDKILSALEEIHREVFRRLTKVSEAAVAGNNAKTHVRPVEFDVGDYVLVSRSVSELGPKLSFRLNGP